MLLPTSSNLNRVNAEDLCESSEINELLTCINRFLALVCILREDNFEKKGQWIWIKLNTFLVTSETYSKVILQISQLKYLSICFTGLIDYNFHCFRQAISEVGTILACLRVSSHFSHTGQPPRASRRAKQSGGKGACVEARVLPKCGSVHRLINVVVVAVKRCW